MGIIKLGENKECVEFFVKKSEDLMVWGAIKENRGDIYVDSIENPKSAEVIVGDFIFLLGEPNEELVLNIKKVKNEFGIVLAEWKEWYGLIEKQYPKHCKKIKRYAIKKEKGVFNRDNLENIAKGLDEKYIIKLIDGNLYEKVMEEEWSRDLCSNFKDKRDYLERGLGFVVLEGEKIISGASSYMAYREAIEVEIDTKKRYRNMGFASIVGAKLILECLDRNIYPSWDAANVYSVALAEKFGYHFSHEYACYEIRW